MADPTPEPHSEAEAPHPGLPGWVKISGIVVAVLVLALVLAMVVAGGEHGPARHG